MELKKITMEEAITSPALSLGEVYMLVRMEEDTTINELNLAEAFFIAKEEREIEKEDDQDRRIRELHEKAQRLKDKLEQFEQRDKIMTDTAGMIDETIKNSLNEPDYFRERNEDLPEFNEELAEELTEEPEPVPEELPKEPEPVPKEPKEKPKGKKQGSKYDLPKIQALLNAGWTTAQLAVEFGISKELMSKNLYHWRKVGKIK